MQIDTCHFEIHVHSLESARAFYCDVLGLEIIQDMPEIKLIAVKAGGVRISIFADQSGEAVETAAPAGGHIIFRTSNLDQVIEKLRDRGFPDLATAEAPGFMRYVKIADFSGNLVEIAEYLRNPLQAE